MEQITDDWDILQTYAREHSQQAFAALGAKYAGMVFNTALRRTGNRDLAEDVTQAVFIVLARRAGHLRPSGSLGAWLHKTTLNASANALRSESRRRKHERVGARPEAVTDPTAGTDLAGEIDQALQRIGRSDREILCRHYLEERPIAEIAQRLELSHDATRKRVTRALERLRGKLAGHQTIGIAAIAGVLSAGGASSSHASAAAIASTAVAGGQNGSAFTLAANVIRGIRLMTMAKAAVVVTMVVISAGAVTSAVVQTKARPPVAATQPAAAQPTTLPTDLIARARAAAKNVRSFYFTIDTDMTYKPSHAEVFVDGWGKQPKLAQITTIGMVQKVHLYDAQSGTSWNYARGGQLLGVTQDEDKPFAGFLQFMEWYKMPGIRRDAAEDKTVNGTKLQAFSASFPPQLLRLWVDERGYLRLMKLTNATNGEEGNGRFEWNVPIDPSHFAPPVGMKSVNPHEYLLSQYPIEGAVFKKEICGMTFCIHRMQQGDDGLIYLVTSTRLAPRFKRLPVGSWDHIGSCTVDGEILNEKNIVTSRMCQVQCLAVLAESGVRIDWRVLIPLGRSPVKEFVVRASTTNQLAKALKSAGMPETQTLIVPAKPVDGARMPLGQFVSEAYRTTLKLDPILHSANLLTVRKGRNGSEFSITMPPETISERDFLSQSQKNIREDLVRYEP